MAQPKTREDLLRKLREESATRRRLADQGQPETRDALMGKLRAESSARRADDNTAKVNSQMDRMLGVAGASRRDSETARRLESQGQPLTRDDLVAKMRADSAARQRSDDNAARVNSQMDRMLGVAGASRRDSETARRLESQGQPLTRDDLVAKMRADSAARQRAYDTAKKTAKSLSPYVAKGVGLLGALTAFPTASDGLVERHARGGGIPEKPGPDTRTPGERVDAMGVFANEEDIARRQEAKELQAEVDAEDYTAAYEQYKSRAKSLGIKEADLMSPEEFVDEMSGTQQSEDGLGRERVGPMVGEDELSRNAEGASLTLDGELGDYSRLPDEDNASRLRSIINDRKAKEPDSPLAAGVAAAAKATRVDPYTGLPMVEGAGNRIEGVPGRDGAPSSAQQFTRATPPEVMEQANQLPTAAERDLYIGRNAIDMEALPPDQRERAARDYAESRRKLRERGNMVPAATDPKTGFYVEVDENNNIKRDEDGNSIPILDADGKPRRSEISSSYTEDGNVLPGSQDVVFIRSEDALKRGRQRTNFNSRMREAQNSGDNLIMSFVTRDPETGGVSFDEAGFEAQYPGSLPAEGPAREKAISQLTNMIERGRAVQQNRDRLGKAQMDRSPTYGPIRMMESLQQAETPEEAATIAMYFNRPDIAQFYQQQAMGDRAVLAETEKAKALAEMRMAGRNEAGGVDTPAGLLEQQNRVINDAIARGDLNGALSILAGPNGHMTEEQVRDQALSAEAGRNPAALNSAMHRPVAEEEFKKVTGVFPIEAWNEESILNAERDFKQGMAKRAGLDPENETVSGILHRMFVNFWNQEFGKNSGRTMGGQDYPRRPAPETAGVGLPDDEQPGTMPGWVNVFRF